MTYSDFNIAYRGSVELKTTLRVWHGSIKLAVHLAPYRAQSGPRWTGVCHCECYLVLSMILIVSRNKYAAYGMDLVCKEHFIVT